MIRGLEVSPTYRCQNVVRVPGLDMPFLGALYRDLLNRALCSPMQGGAALAARKMHLATEDDAGTAVHKAALCSCHTQPLDGAQGRDARTSLVDSPS